MNKSKNNLSKILVCIILVTILSSLLGCSKKDKQINIINMSENQVASIYKDIKTGDSIKTVVDKLGNSTTTTKSDIANADKKYIWMAIDFGHKYIECDVDKNGNIIAKRTELKAN